MTSTGAVAPTADAQGQGRSKSWAPWWRVRRWVPLLAVWIASAAYVGARLDRGWIPHDEGTLAHSAERVVQGELPHRDFDDAYTGGLTRFDAVVFETLGTRLLALRIALYLVLLLWVPAVFYIATRFATPSVAAAVTLLCVVWSIPSYPAALPSWYNLFLATFGAAALFRFTETRRRVWLIAAGVLGGLSVLVKIIGLYFVAAAVFFAAFDEYRVAAAEGRGHDVKQGRVFASIVSAACAIFVLGLVRMARVVPGGSPILHFVLPGAALAAFLCSLEWIDPPDTSWPVRVKRLAAMAGLMAAGGAMPIALFLARYIASGSVGSLVHGVFVEPAQRFTFESAPPVPLRTVPAALAWLLVLVPYSAGQAATNRTAERRTEWVTLACYALVLAGLAYAATRGGSAYVGPWIVVSYVAPCTVLGGCLLLARRVSRERLPSVRDEQLWLLVCVTALCSLVQMPYANWLYVLYFAPLAILALLAIVTTRPSGPGPRTALVAAFFLVYGVTALNPGRVTVIGTRVPDDEAPRAALRIPRTGLYTSAAEAAEYERLTALVQAHSGPGDYIYAAPDCPEVYFLAQRRNPTRTLFDFFDEPAGHDARVLRVVDSTNVRVVALNRWPLFSPRIDPALETALRTRFPDSVTVGNFVVRWHDGP
jgi:hypothetical protein